MKPRNKINAYKEKVSGVGEKIRHFKIKIGINAEVMRCDCSGSVSDGEDLHLVDYKALTALQEELTETRLTYYQVVEQRNHLYTEGAKLSKDVDNLIQERGKLNQENKRLREQLKLVTEMIRVHNETCPQIANMHRLALAKGEV